jgi:hypothetical protein
MKIYIKEAETKDKTYNASDIDSLKQKVTTAILTLKQALESNSVNADAKYLEDCTQIYNHINEMPSGRKIITNLSEDIVIDAKSRKDTVRDAIEHAKSNETNVIFKESDTERRFVGELQMYIYGKDSAEAKAKLDGMCKYINGKFDLDCKSKVVGQNKAYESNKSLNDLLGEKVIVETITVKNFKNKNSLLNETITAKDFKAKYKLT